MDALKLGIDEERDHRAQLMEISSLSFPHIKNNLSKVAAPLKYYSPENDSAQYQTILRSKGA